MDDLKIITIIVNLCNKQQLWNFKYQLLIHDQNFCNQALLFVITLNKDDDSNVESCCVTSDARHPRVCLRKKRDTWLKMARLSPFVPFGLVLAFQAWLWPFWHFILPYYLRKRCHLCSVVELSTWFTREFPETVRFRRAGQSTLPD